MKALILAGLLVGSSLATACTYQDGRLYIATKPEHTKAQLASGEVECRTERPIGSNMPQKICASQAEWAAYDEEAQAASERLMDGAGSTGQSFEGN